ncbi:hypothetical protein DPMN_114693 [Dreissena polymorpha]|uniref:Uncharacterized protein n=1 Tax=Dreissena polymorpha TaxID=45954 RepID=A0A9D4KKP8_DREPO|nr:hypothetical protein DPMN_114693 [Dreissena polymorpha]
MPTTLQQSFKNTQIPGEEPVLLHQKSLRTNLPLLVLPTLNYAVAALDPYQARDKYAQGSWMASTTGEETGPSSDPPLRDTTPPCRCRSRTDPITERHKN